MGFAIIGVIRLRPEMEEPWRIWEDGGSSKSGGPQPNIQVSVQDPDASRALNSAIFVPVTSTYLLDYLWNLSKSIPLKALVLWASELGCKRIIGEIIYKADTKFHPQREPDSVGLGWSLMIYPFNKHHRGPHFEEFYFRSFMVLSEEKEDVALPELKGRRNESAPKGPCAGATTWELGLQRLPLSLPAPRNFRDSWLCLKSHHCSLLLQWLVVADEGR